VPPMSVDRAKLYVEVWAEPMTTVAKRYDVSSSFLARVCERLNVPRPRRGYWAQRAVGVDLEQPPLLDAEPGAELEWVRDGSAPRLQPMSASQSRPKAKGKLPARDVRSYVAEVKTLGKRSPRSRSPRLSVLRLEPSRDPTYKPAEGLDRLA
jgi:hypothetical protein